MGLSPDQFWSATWWELDLLSRQHQRRIEQEWDYTRHIMASIGGGKPKDIITLPTIDSIKKTSQAKAPTPEEQDAMIERFKHFFT